MSEAAGPDQKLHCAFAYARGAMTSTKDPNSPFAALEAMRAELPAGPEPRALPTKLVKGPSRAVVRYERKGRRGKEATVVEKLGLAPVMLETWLKELKAALGCGGAIEDDTILLQGDQRTRLPALLTAKGVGKVTVS